MGQSKTPKHIVFGLFLACWSFSYNEAFKLERNVSTSTRSDHMLPNGAVFVQIWSSVNKTGPWGSALDQLIDIFLTTLLREGVVLRLDYPICLIERPLLQVSNVLVEGLHRVYRDCPTRISSEVLTIRGSTVRNNFVDLCFRLEELTMFGKFSTGFHFITPQLVKARLLPTSIQLKLQILPQASSKTENNDRNVRQLLQLSELGVDRWSGLRFEFADVEENYMKRFLLKMLEMVTRIFSFATRIAFQRSLRISMQQIFTNLTFIDPLFYSKL
uniref:Uncharacterized protein n=1 Tax=Schistocephalus solidus TaxID=70667 RepID=A0A0X3PLQ5_SCHSO